MNRIFKFIFSSLIIFITIFLTTSRKTYAAVLFQDDFSDPDLDSVLNRWETPRNSCNSNWVLNNGRIGIKTLNNPGACQTEFAPKDSVWGGWNNYIYEVDMILPPNSGTDKNTAFRYSGSPNFNWYGLHFQVGQNNSNVVMERVCFSPCNNSTTYPVTNGNTYHLKMIADENHISAYIDGNLVLDIPQAERGFNTGKIALRAGVGGDKSTEVYFDNVVVSSIDAPVEPIVIIPGMLGSWCKDAIANGTDCPANWTALPEPLDPYDSLVSSIINAPDIPDSDVFVWYYDWRKPITDLASQLNTYINSTALAGKPAGTKVKVVGHSYGGLIASKFAEDNSTKVGKLITVGSPHKGTVMAYGAWEGGEIWDFPVWQKIPLELLLTARAGVFQTSKDTIRNDFKSVKEILPTFDYLTNQSNQTISETTMSQRNSQLPGQYTGLSSIKSLLTTITGLENSSSDTLSSIKTTPRNWMEKAFGLWEDGKPTQFTRSADGDLTVLRDSGRYNDAASKPEITADHEGLISSIIGIDQILQSLGSTGTASITSDNPNDNNGLAVFFLRSPATISVNFNGTNYLDSDNDGLIVIEDVGSGTATATLTGTGNGAYHLDILQFHPNGDTAYTYSGTITTGNIQTLNFDLNPANPDNLTPAEDTTGEIYLTQAINLATETAGKITASTGRARAKNLLAVQNQNIKKIIQSAKQNIANPSNSLKYIQEAILKLHRLRRDINAGDNSLQLNSTDAVKIRKLTEDSIEKLQSAFNIVSARASKNYSSRQISDLANIASKAQTKTDLKASTATKGLIIAAPAAQAGQNDILEASASGTPNQAAYISYISSRLYFEEAMEIMK